MTNTRDDESVLRAMAHEMPLAIIEDELVLRGYVAVHRGWHRFAIQVLSGLVVPPIKDMLLLNYPPLGDDDYTPEQMTFEGAVVALQALIDEPYGCTLCDCGRPRNPAKGHQPDCPYERARAVLSKGQE